MQKNQLETLWQRFYGDFGIDQSALSTGILVLGVSSEQGVLEFQF